ncbi:MAG: ABC transporter permease [Chloroflexi bacterium]|nr:MAG: inner-membrane translocator [Chloroflexi bacterium OLB13]MBC6956547.1 ABC transporter permease [Chloroflexota bacterium]MBV6437959.1 Autoinducer 2 import system permease protein LsrD [Anaerolineae bacterium]MDL1916142.1 ABC transporter permease [Anaerolineae bacterium CFX4]OQY76965.1 MAG: sugar ABC transporter permease [Anaerolineae bacterium UTCFX5]
MTLLRRLAQMNPALLALLLAVVLFFAGGLINPNFVNVNQAINIVRLAAFLGIIAAGQTLVIISGGEGIDLSVGGVVTLAAILVFRFSGGDTLGLIPAGALALAAGTLIGVINGLGVIAVGIPPLVMTLGMTGVIQGTILVVTQGQLIGSTPPIMAQLISQPLILGIPGVVILWLALGGLMWLLLERTTYGKQLFAVGVNRTTARLSGVRVPRVVITTYALSGFLSALAGVMLLGFTQTVFLNLGGAYLFPSIAAVVVGGTVLAGGKGSYWGTMSGALVLTLIDSLLRAAGIEQAYQSIILGGILLALLSIYGRQHRLRQ